MNAFRLVGDLFHLIALVLLLTKIWTSRSVAGEVASKRNYDCRSFERDEHF